MELIYSKICLLPREIIELILSACYAKVLAIQIPRVSKLFRKLSEDNSNIWRAKCEQKYSSLNSKPSDQTWKQYYFPELLKLFPIDGFIFTKSTRQDLLNHRRAKVYVRDEVEQIEVNNIIYEVAKTGIFDELILYNYRTERLPRAWRNQGLSWQISWIELKELLRHKVGNYSVDDQPCNALNVSGGDERIFFSASISSVIREKHGDCVIYYELHFGFYYGEGNETTAGTLYSVWARERHYDDSSVRYLIKRYERRECQD